MRAPSHMQAPIDADKIAGLMRIGVGTGAIAERLGVTRNSVRRAMGLLPPRLSPWTPEMDARLVELAAKRKSAREISLALGVSRNGVIGRCHRIGVTLCSPNAGKNNKPAAAKPRMRTAKKAASMDGRQTVATYPSFTAASTVTREERPSLILASVDGRQPVHPRPILNTASAGTREEKALPPIPDERRLCGIDATMALRAGLCHWPINDTADPRFTYCFEATAFGAVYCCEHTQKAGGGQYTPRGLRYKPDMPLSDMDRHS